MIPNLIHDVCPVCLEEVNDDIKDSLKITDCCGKYFHFTCYYQWMNVNPTCPLCRSEKQQLPHIVSMEVVENDATYISYEQNICSCGTYCNVCMHDVANILYRSWCILVTFATIVASGIVVIIALLCKNNMPYTININSTINTNSSN